MWKLRILDFYEVHYLKRVRSKFLQKLCTSCLKFPYFFKTFSKCTLISCCVNHTEKAMNMTDLEIQLTTCLYKCNHKCQSLGFSVNIKLTVVSGSCDSLYILLCNLLITTQEKLQPQSSFILLTMPAHMWSKQCTVQAPWWILPLIQSLVKQPRLNLKNSIISKSQRSGSLGWLT